MKRLLGRNRKREALLKNSLVAELDPSAPAVTEPRIFIITGDHSGDLHAAHVVEELRRLNPAVEVEAVGGPALQALGVPLLANHKHMNQVGIWGPLKTLPHHLQLAYRIKQRLRGFQPHAVLLVDYGGFNLRMAQLLRQRLFYYIPPQVWASRRGRIKAMRNTLERVFCIFPFEQPLYESEGIPVTYVGHPLVQQLPAAVDKRTFCQRHGLDEEKLLVGLFPGSRQMEIDYLLKPLVAAMPRLRHLVRKQYGKELEVVLAQASSLDEQRFAAQLDEACYFGKERRLHRVCGENHALLSAADLALGASGTVTLEAALYDTPMVIAYKGHAVVYQIAKRVIQVPYLGLPNLLNGGPDPILPEVLQDAVTPDQLAQAALPFCDPHSDATGRAKEAFQHIRQVLGAYNAARAVAEGMLASLQ